MTLSSRIEVYRRTFLGDSRGWFLKAMTGKEAQLHDCFGEIYVVSIAPGQVRGNHFHPRCAEWFTVVEGNCLAVLSDHVAGERLELTLEAPATLYVPAGISHAFTPSAQGPHGRVILLAYAELPYDPADTIESRILAAAVDE